MFGRMRKKYEREKRQREKVELYYGLLDRKHDKLIGDYNRLVRKINAKGGSAFLNGDPAPQLTHKEVNQMLMLCHPDRHDGSDLSVTVTRKLITIKQEL